MFQVGERKRSRRTLEGEQPSSRRRLSVTSIGEEAPLKDAVVCLTGLPADEKTRLHQFVEQLGGSFTRDLDTAKNTHLIAKEPEGAKYDTAITCSRIRVVSPAWLNECVTTGSRADEGQYLLKSSSEHDFPPLLQEIQELVDGNTRNSLFEACRFLLLGFEEDSDVKTKLSRLVRRGKGTIYWELNEEVTHVIVADDCDETHRDAARTISLHHPNGPATVSPFWIVSSWKDTTLGPVSSFPPRKTIAKPAAKKAAKSIKAKKRQPSNLFQGSVFAILRITPPEGAVDFNIKELEMCITSNGGQLLSAEMLEALRADKTSQDSQLRTCHVVCWGGYSHAHLMVHPLLSRVEKEKLCTILPVTPVWLYACSADGKLLKPTKCPTLFQPQPWSIRQLSDSKKGKENGIKVCVTGFVGSERTGIVQALRIIGADYTENLRSTNTHLICKESKGAKYERAVKWGLHVVSVEWLKHILEHGYEGKNGSDNKNEGCESRFSMAGGDTREKPQEAVNDNEATQKLSQTSDGGLSLHNELESQWSPQDARDIMTVEETQHG